MPERRITVARTLFSRMRGLLGRKALPSGEGLLIRPCRAIHTLGMHFAIDARFYDRRGVCVREVRNVPPGRWWVWGTWRAEAVLESMAGDDAFDGLDALPEELIER